MAEGNRAVSARMGRALLSLLIAAVLISGLLTPLEMKLYLLVAGTWILSIVAAPFLWLGIPAMSWIFTPLYLVFVTHGLLRRRRLRRSGRRPDPFAARPPAPWLMELAQRSAAMRRTAAFLLHVGPFVLYIYGMSIAIWLVFMIGYATLAGCHYLDPRDVLTTVVLVFIGCLMAARPTRKAIVLYPYYFARMMSRRILRSLEYLRAA